VHVLVYCHICENACVYGCVVCVVGCVRAPGLGRCVYLSAHLWSTAISVRMPVSVAVSYVFVAVSVAVSVYV